ncbi:unnamed protein product [Eruca vesicaria subsp. sativa]|uniref:Uncharacterized protein n=1 Tax=Eruca vesicaria subsp. sativa TaxID=29727 RepID=A0ABC8LR92_ERUVS|nr:unnamed protein product [Eruca vesicaria subsp. sativa]
MSFCRLKINSCSPDSLSLSTAKEFDRDRPPISSQFHNPLRYFAPSTPIRCLTESFLCEDQFDTINLSDNEIVKLENFPLLNRLGTLIINNNRNTRINPNIREFLPKLHTLVLTNNMLVNLVEIDPLASIPKLQYLSLLPDLNRL